MWQLNIRMLWSDLKASYESWWKQVSADGDEYVRIVIGSDFESPTRLNCMDWHGDGSDLANNQSQIRSGPIANGFWALDVNRAGQYRFELRRWPREVDLPINAEYHDPKPNREKTLGVSIGAKQAGIIIGDFNQTKPVLDGREVCGVRRAIGEGADEPSDCLLRRGFERARSILRLCGTALRAVSAWKGMTAMRFDRRGFLVGALSAGSAERCGRHAARTRSRVRPGYFFARRLADRSVSLSC